MMAKATVLLLGIYMCAVQGAVMRDEDKVLNRLTRSPGHCAECEDHHGSPSLPGIPSVSTPVFHTQQWSGLTRTNGGLEQRVFSGAAAGVDGGVQSGSQAFSLASTAVGTGPSVDISAPEQPSNNNDSKNSDSFGRSSGGADGFDAKADGIGASEKINGGKISFKESHFSYQNGGGKHFGPQKDFGFYAGRGFDHHKFSGHRHSHGGFGGDSQIQTGFGSGSASASSSSSSSTSNGPSVGLGSDGHFESGNSGYVSQNNQYGQSTSGSNYSAHGKTNGFSGNDQQQQLQLGSQSGYGQGSASGQEGAGYGKHTGSGSAGHFESGNSGYGRLNSQYSHSSAGSGYNAHGKSNEFSENQQQQFQQGSQRGYGPGSGSGQEGAGYGQHTGSGSAGHFESENSGYGGLNSQYSHSSAGSGYNAYGKSNEFSQNQQQQFQQGSQRGYGSGSGSGQGGDGYGQGFGVGTGHFGSEVSQYGQMSSDYNSNGKSTGFYGNEQKQQQLQLGSQSGTESGAGRAVNDAAFGKGAGLDSARHFESGSSNYGGKINTGSGYSALDKSTGFSGERQQKQQVESGSQTGIVSGSDGRQDGFTSGSSSSSSKQSGGISDDVYGSNQHKGSDLQTGLGGALKLASQGLQQAQQQQSGCSTCGKSSYALSNAKSRSGSAIALSVAG